MSRNDLEDELPETDIPHAIAARETGFWGRQGAGCIVLSRSTGRVLVGLRSQEVMEPGTWGTFGGALNEGLSAEQGALLELFEETGLDNVEELLPLFVFEAPGGVFRYSNFLAIVEDEFEPTLNWENDDGMWVLPDRVPEPRHFGLQAILAHETFDRVLTEAFVRPRP